MQNKIKISDLLNKCLKHTKFLQEGGPHSCTNFFILKRTFQIAQFPTNNPFLLIPYVPIRNFFLFL